MTDDSQTIAAVLTAQAAATPDKVYATFDMAEPDWTYARTRHLTARTGDALQQIGVRAGDRVLCWLPNGPELLRCWFGASWIGATYVPVNTSLRGALLDHVIRSSRARVLVVHRDLVDRLTAADLHAVNTVVVVGADAGEVNLPTVTVLSWADFDSKTETPPAKSTDADIQSIIFTSGTTGPSKGVLSSYRHIWATANAAFGAYLGPEDRYMVNLPLFHAGGTIGVYGMLSLGGSITIVSSFSTDTFWATVKRHGITSCTLLGVMATFLGKLPPTSDDPANPLRYVYMVPLTEDAASFGSRFGVTVVTLFNMTEVSCPLVSEPNPSSPGTCGRPRAGVEVRLVDSDGRDVAPGEIGELLVRTADPMELNSGYDGLPDDTAKAWRGGWFHTGDCFRRNDRGEYFFVDRVKDAIRRRGENISSFEVEAEALAHPDVREAAAVATPSVHGEDEVLLAVAPVTGHHIDPVELVEFLIPRMAHFMVPRFVRVLDDLPKTPTSKVKKHLLRTEGVTGDTFDREAAGIVIRRETLA